MEDRDRGRQGTAVDHNAASRQGGRFFAQTLEERMSLNRGCRATTITRHPAVEQGGATAALNNEAQEGRERARQIAREYLDSTSFLQCCWEILVFRMVREAAETALGLILWGQLSENLVETCRFPTTLARIHILNEAATPDYRDHYADEEELLSLIHI